MIINHDKYYNPTFRLEQDPHYTHIFLWPSIHDSASGVIRCSERKTKFNQQWNTFLEESAPPWLATNETGYS